MMRAPVRPDAPEAEAYRHLRAALAYGRLGDGRRTVMVTSARRHEGKSTTAVNLATVCAYAERGTLLVDGDLRNPQLDELFGQSKTHNFARLLRGDDNVLEKSVLGTSVSCLDFLPSGGPVGTSAELLSRPLLQDVLQQAREAYDWVVVDAPPVLPVADALVLARAVDGVILIVDVHSTPIRDARRAIELLRAVDAPLVGVVANRSPTRETATAYGVYPD